MALEGLTEGHYWTFLLWGMGASVILLMLIGSGSRIVVFNDATDMFWTAGIIIFPIVTFLFFIFAVPKDATVTLAELPSNYPFIAAGIGIGLLCFGVSVLWTIVQSIRHNGFFTGLIMAVLKLTACAVILLGLFGVAHLRGSRDSDNREANNAIALLVFGIFMFIASRMINGERVMERRERLAYEAEAEALA